MFSSYLVQCLNLDPEHPSPGYLTITTIPSCNLLAVSTILSVPRTMILTQTSSRFASLLTSVAYKVLARLFVIQPCLSKPCHFLMLLPRIYLENDILVRSPRLCLYIHSTWQSPPLSTTLPPCPTHLDNMGNHFILQVLRMALLSRGFLMVPWSTWELLLKCSLCHLHILPLSVVF